MITEKQLAYAENVYGRRLADQALARKLDTALLYARGWLRLPDPVKKIPFKGIETMLAVSEEWNKSAQLRKMKPETLDEALDMVARQQKSSVLRKRTAREIQEAVAHMETWRGQSRFRNASPGELLDAAEAFKGKSPAELNKAGVLDKAWQQSPKFRSKAKPHRDKALALYTFWHANKRIFKNASPEELAEAEVIAGEWKKVFGTQKPEALIRADALATEWKKHPKLQKETPASLKKALAVAEAWNKIPALRSAKVKDVEAALAWIREIAKDAKPLKREYYVIMKRPLDIDTESNILYRKSFGLAQHRHFFANDGNNFGRFMDGIHEDTASNKMRYEQYGNGEKYDAQLIDEARKEYDQGKRADDATLAKYPDEDRWREGDSNRYILFAQDCQRYVEDILTIASELARKKKIHLVVK